MRVYLIAAPEDEAEGDKLADYLKRFGVFIRREYGKYSYPPARHGEYTLALWSRNAMMSSRQMMLTNRAIDAWENDHLIMARLEHGLSPRGLADLKMVDLTFEAAREHRYRDVMTALRALEDAKRAPASPPPNANAPPSSSSGGSEPKSSSGGLFGAIGGIFDRSKKSEAAPRARRSETQAEEMTAGIPASAPAPESDAVAAPDAAHEVFVSYSHANADTVLPIVQTVEERGVSIWIDRDEMRAGQGWAGQIVRAIKTSERFCLMCSAQAFASDHVRREVYLADKYGKDMVPIRLDGAEMPEDIEYFLIGKQWLDLNALQEDERLEALEMALSGAAN